MILIATIEVIATSGILIISPSLFGWLIFGAELSEAGQALGRLAGIALLGFGLASWPAASGGAVISVVRALLIYNVLAAIYLFYLAIAGQLAGVLLSPAVALHTILSILVFHAWRVARGRRSAPLVHSSNPQVTDG